ncbi:MAG TPA: TonB-dependent receptor [Phenylobacterium sp.]|uniref:TonB-dependent receptor n=1 Tax=Phenylobacterium sp. TaxID=1871053 RepID=UPI002B4903FF|nr:TonB-dependent receptor [Phenylobacterium sp.]HKR89657.1 TonB-dependent receptor [Phenylobacterium sp.]HKT14640.1 TonB-dependent receptor [Allosphingosinicella sp.]
MRIGKFERLAIRSLLTGSICLTPLALHAQSIQTPQQSRLGSTDTTPVTHEAPPSGNTLGEIVVTAQKREQRLSDIGIAVSALGREDISAIGRQDVTALTTKVPNLQVNQYSPTITVFNIRGVSQNDFADSQEAPIAFYNDEVYVAQLGAISGQNFDLERVEVLRGPQGTLFGRNATGGLIQIITAKPTRTLDGFLTLTGGSYGQFASEGAISGPLSDSIRARLSFTTDNHNGYINNSLGRSLGGSKFYAGRLQVAADVGGGVLTVKGQLLRNDHDSNAGMYSAGVSTLNSDGLGVFIGPNDNPYGTCPGCNLLGYQPPANPLHVEDNHQPDFNRTYWSLTANYSKDLGPFKLTSISDYQNLKKNYTEDSDVSPIEAFNYSTAQRAYQYSQEIRLSEDLPTLSWVAGLYALKIHTDNHYIADFTGIGGPIFNYGGALNTRSIAVFAQLEKKLTDTVSLIGGLRYSNDRKTLDYLAIDSGDGPFVFNKSTYPSLADRKFGNYSAKVELDYHFSPGNLLYVSVNRGTKSGGFGTLSLQPIDPNAIPFKQEVLTNFESGVKLTMLDHRMHLGASAFHYRYHDYQLFEIIGVNQYVVNSDARITGLELNTDVNPAPGLTFQAFATYLDSRIIDVRLPSGRLADRRLPQAPRYSVGGTARYEFPLGSGTGAIATDWKWNSSSYFSAFNAPVDLEKSYAVGNVRATYSPPAANWELALFVNNVADKRYRIYNLDITSIIGISEQVYARPRWFGGSITYRLR